MRDPIQTLFDTCEAAEATDIVLPTRPQLQSLSRETLSTSEWSDAASRIECRVFLRVLFEEWRVKPRNRLMALTNWRYPPVSGRITWHAKGIRTVGS
jgi:hypothetical protein